MMMEQLGKFEKKEKTFMRDDLNDDEKQKVGKDNNKRKKEKRYNLDYDGKEQLRKYEKNKKRDQRLRTLEERSSTFNNVQMYNKVDPCILATSAFRLIEEDFKGAIHEGPTYICDIC